MYLFVPQLKCIPGNGGAELSLCLVRSEPSLGQAAPLQLISGWASLQHTAEHTGLSHNTFIWDQAVNITQSTRDILPEMISEKSEAGAGSEESEESMNLCTQKSEDADEHNKYKHKNLDEILPDPENIIGLGESQLGKN